MRTFLFAVLTALLLCASVAYAYNDKVTHPDITEQAIYVSKLHVYLVNTVELGNGVNSLLKYALSDPNGKLDEAKVKLYNSSGWPIRELLRAGSTLEDDPACRASNHFHDPLKVWTEAGLSDSGYGLLDLACWKWKLTGEDRWQSNVVWATGLKDKGGESRFDYGNVPEGETYYNWDVVRAHYHDALVSPVDSEREEYFARTFLELGHVIHLLEDAAVPAHTRNDMKGHLSFMGVMGFDPTNWFGNLYEYYVSLHPSIVTDAARTAGDYKPKFSRFTDFWDTDRYYGQNPSFTASTANIGLAEYTHANFFSDDTINMGANEVEGDYPYPNRASTSLDPLLKGQVEPMRVTAEDGKEDLVFYVSKIAGVRA